MRSVTLVSRSLRSGALLASFALFMSVGGAGCSSCNKTAGIAATRDDMALVPREVNFVAQANFKKLRSTAVWKRFIDFTDSSPEQKAKYAELVKQTGLDPFKQIDSGFLALPAANAGGDFAAILRGGPFDEDKLVAYVKTQLKNEGGDVVPSDYHGRKRYTDGRGGTSFVCFLDKSTIVLGSDAWTKKIIDQAAKPGSEGSADSAQANVELAALVKKTRSDGAMWGAGLVAADVRARLAANDQLKSAGSMKDVYMSIDMTGGFKFDAVVDLGSDADATDLATRLKDQLAQSRQNPQIQILGFGRYFDAIKVSSQASALHIDAKLDQAGLDDLIERAAGLFRTLGNSLGGVGGAPPSMPMAPPSPMQVPPMAPPQGMPSQ